MAVVIPFQNPPLPFYQFSTTIENVEYFFNVRWNGRDQAWYFDVLTLDNEPIASGIKVVLGTFLGRTTIHPLFRNGAFAALDNSSSGKDAGFYDLGTRVIVIWMSTAEILSWRVNAEYPDPTAT